MKKYIKNNAKIKAAIPYGGLKEIAKMSNTSIYTVSRVVNGVSRNLKVIEAITEYLKSLEQTNKNLDDALSTLSN